MTKDSLHRVIQHVLPKLWWSNMSHVKMISTIFLGFPELQEATTNRRHIFWTSKIFKRKMGHSEGLTASLQETPKPQGYLGNFEGFMYTGWHSLKLFTLHAPCRLDLEEWGICVNTRVWVEKVRLSALIYIGVLSDTLLCSTFYSLTAKNAVEKQGMLWSSVF